MYNIPYFKAGDRQEVLRFMEEHPFTMLIGSNKELPVATQVPFLLVERGEKLFLQGHIMRHTDHHKAFLQNPNVLCVFTGPHAYVSARHYADPHTASTWNYMSVHAVGTLSFVGEETLIDILQRTTDGFEKDPHSPSAFARLPKDYVDRLAKAIVGIEVEVTSLDPVFKLSQNKDRQTFERIVDNLDGGGCHEREVAAQMKKRYSSIFNQEK